MSELNAHISLFHFLKIASAKLPDLAFVWHTRNENADEAERKRGGQIGVIPGVWDVMYIGTNQAPIGTCRPLFFQGVAIELKSTKAYPLFNHGLTIQQANWRERYTRNGWHTAIYPENDWVGAAHLLVRWVGGNVEDFRF